MLVTGSCWFSSISRNLTGSSTGLCERFVAFSVRPGARYQPLFAVSNDYRKSVLNQVPGCFDKRGNNMISQVANSREMRFTAKLSPILWWEKDISTLGAKLSYSYQLITLAHQLVASDRY